MEEEKRDDEKDSITLDAAQREVQSYRHLPEKFAVEPLTVPEQKGRRGDEICESFQW